VGYLIDLKRIICQVQEGSELNVQKFLQALERINKNNEISLLKQSMT